MANITFSNMFGMFQCADHDWYLCPKDGLGVVLRCRETIFGTQVSIVIGTLGHADHDWYLHQKKAKCVVVQIPMVTGVLWNANHNW